MRMVKAKKVSRMSKQDHQSIQYFKAHALYKKLFIKFKKKYESLGKIGGSVSLIQFSDNEIEELAEFLGIRPDILLKKRRITLLQFEKQLKKYKFDDLDLRQLLELYFGESLISNSQRQEQQALELRSYLNHLKMNYSSAEIWLDYLEGKSSDSYWIYRLMEESYDDFESYVDILDRVLQNIPEKPVRLPVFAQQMTGNPHAFDRNQNLGRLLIHVLTVREARYDHEKVVMPTTSEGINELLLTYNILRDDIANYVTVANLMADTDSPKKEFWKIACDTRVVQNVPIRELIHLDSLYPSNHKKDVWIVENSGVFSSILDAVPEAPLICTHGQFKLASWKCFDLLVKNGIRLHYSSDLDPEGIGMAQRLLNRYPDFVELWEMTEYSYAKSVSNGDSLSEARLKKLNAITNQELLAIKHEMNQNKAPGYQEALLDDMIEFLQKHLRD